MGRPSMQVVEWPCEYGTHAGRTHDGRHLGRRKARRDVLEDDLILALAQLAEPAFRDDELEVLDGDVGRTSRRAALELGIVAGGGGRLRDVLRGMLDAAGPIGDEEDGREGVGDEDEAEEAEREDVERRREVELHAPQHVLADALIQRRAGDAVAGERATDELKASDPVKACRGRWTVRE